MLPAKDILDKNGLAWKISGKIVLPDPPNGFVATFLLEGYDDELEEMEPIIEVSQIFIDYNNCLLRTKLFIVG